MAFGYFFEPVANEWGGGPKAYFYNKAVRKNPLPNEINFFPISVVLTRYNIQFYFHGYRLNEVSANKDEAANKSISHSSIRTKKEIDKNLPLTDIYYSSSQIFQLPISEFTQDELTDELKRFRPKDESNNLDPLLDERLYEKVEGVFSYKKLEEFEIISEKFPNGIFLPELILDFLFDFLHSEVFRTNPHYTILKEYMLKNPMMKIILQKLEYQFSVEKLKTLIVEKNNSLEIEDISEGKQKNQVKRLESFEKNAVEATDHWVNLILEDSGKIIRADNFWFQDIESEHKNVYKKKSKEFNSKKLSEKVKKKAEDSVQWLLDRYDIIEAFRLQFKYLYTKVWSGGFSLPFLLFLILLIVIVFGYIFGLNGIVIFEYGVHLSKMRHIFYIFFFSTLLGLVFLSGVALERIIQFVISFFTKSKGAENKLTTSEVLLSIPKIINFFKPRIFLVSSGIWGIILVNQILWDIDFNLNVGFKRPILFVLVILTILFLFQKFDAYVKIIDKGKKFWNITKRTVVLLLIGMLYSFVIGFFGISYSINDNLYKKIGNPDYWSQGAYNQLEEKGKLYFNKKILKESDSRKVNSILSKTDFNISEHQLPEIMENVIPYLKFNGKRRVGPIIKLEIRLSYNSQWNIKFLVLQDMLIFYAVIAFCLGLIIEVGTKSGK